MLFAELVAVSDRVRETSSRTAKAEALAAGVRALAAVPEEVEPGVAFLAGELLQRQLGIGWAGLRDVQPPPAAEPVLSVGEVAAAFDRLNRIAGRGSVQARRDELGALLTAATAPEQAFVRGLLGGGLRQGALVGSVTDAVARAAEVPLAVVRRALMLVGALPPVAVIALAEGRPGLEAVRLEVGRPIGPMLAGTAGSVADALAKVDGPVYVDAKLDGARVQVHRDGDAVGVFTRSLDDVTARVPEIVAAARALPCTSVVLDGEAIALREDGRPQPFQVTASRFGSRGTSDVELTLQLFDVLHLDGADLLDEPLSVRAAALADLVPAAGRIARVLADGDAAGADAEAALAAALDGGHEGVVVKALDAPYAAGRRGAGWLKVKPVHTLDLVVLGVEWGSGRRRGKLSNLHLGARADDGDGFVMLGKTFKGLTDALLAWQTERLLALADGPTDGWQVRVRPELVVEIAIDGVQRSTRYPGGVALRFARVVRYREDKTPAEADTLATVRAFLG